MDDHVPVVCRVTRRVCGELDALAAELGFTRSSTITYLISAGLRNQELLFGPLLRARAVSDVAAGEGIRQGPAATRVRRVTR